MSVHRRGTLMVGGLDESVSTRARGGERQTDLEKPVRPRCSLVRSLSVYQLKYPIRRAASQRQDRTSVIWGRSVQSIPTAESKTDEQTDGQKDKPDPRFVSPPRPSSSSSGCSRLPRPASSPSSVAVLATARRRRLAARASMWLVLVESAMRSESSAKDNAMALYPP